MLSQAWAGPCAWRAAQDLVSATELRVTLGESLNFLSFRCSTSKMSTASSGLVRTPEATFLRGLLHNGLFMLEAAGIIRATAGASGSLSWEACPWGLSSGPPQVCSPGSFRIMGSVPDILQGLSSRETVAPPVVRELSGGK